MPPATLEVGDGSARSEGGICQAATGSVPYGGGCACAQDCAGGVPCVSEKIGGPPRGACWSICIVANPDCPAGTACSQTGADPELGFCQQSCTSSSQCREGQGCLEGFCRGMCLRDEECVSGRCNGLSGACHAANPEGPVGLMEPCLRSEQCQSGFCSSSLGRCLTFCALDRGCAVGTCAVVSTSAPDLGLCLDPCRADADCKPGLACLRSPTGAWFCFPPRS
jgi:hypothetical protein